MTQDNQFKGKTASLLTGILILAIGIILTACNKMITGHGIIVLGGILFVLTGIINIVIYVTRKSSDGKKINTGFSLFFGWLVSIASIILGLCMLVFVKTFSDMIPFIFGLLILFGAVMLTFTMGISVRKFFRVPVWMWAFPLVMAVLGVVTITRKAAQGDSTIMILTGVSMILFGLAGMIVGGMAEGVKHRKETTEPTTPATIDVEATEPKTLNQHND